MTIKHLSFALPILCLLPVIAGAAPRATDPGIEIIEALREPVIVTPTAIAVMADGAVLVVECHTHFRPPDYQGPPADRIRRCFDTDGDGRLDQVTTFYEGTQATMGLSVYKDGSVLVATRREVFRLFDDDHDGAADRRQEIARLETKGDYPHNGLSGLAFDDKFVYFGLGENLGEPYALIGADGTTLRGGGEGGNIYAIQADGSKLSRVATGFWNPFALCVDTYNQLFAVDNDPDSRPPCRLLHVVPGGDYGYRFRNGRKGVHPFTAWNGELPGTLPMLAGTGEAPSGMIYYDDARMGMAWLLRGSLVSTSWGDHRLEQFAIAPRDDWATYSAKRRTLVEGDEDFRPVGIALTAAGDMYVSDWVDKSYELHGKGRVWLVRAKRDPDVGEQSRRKLLLARLVEAAAPRFHAFVAGEEVVEEPPPLESLAKVAAIRDPAQLPDLIGAACVQDPFFRAAARVALPHVSGPQDWLGWLTKPARNERKRLMAAIQLRDYADRGDEIPAGCIDIILADADRDVRFVGIQWVAEARLTEHRQAIEKLLDAPSFDSRQFEACLMALRMLDSPAGTKIEELAGEDLVVKLVGDPARTPAARAAALRLARPDHPGVTATLLSDLLSQESSVLRQAAVETLILSTLPLKQEMLRRLVRGEATPAELRIEAVVGLDPREEASRKLLVELLDSPDQSLLEEAARSLRGVELAESERARLLAIFNDSRLSEALRDLVSRVLNPPTGEAQADSTAYLAMLEKLAASGRPEVGRRVFFHPQGAGCFRCHRVGGRGGSAGPDLSSIGLRERRRLIESIVDPAREVAPQYATSTVITTDGRTLVGLVEDRPATAEVAITDSQGKTTVLPAADVAERSLSGATIMPTGLIKQMTLQELTDLVSWLESLK